MKTQEFSQFLRTHGSIFRGLSESDKIQIKHEIQAGFLHGLSKDEISLYARNGLSPLQMQTIRIAIEEGIPAEFIQEQMLKKELTNEAILQVKIAYYKEAETVTEEVPEVYLKAVQLELSKLESQIEQQQEFFGESLQTVREEKQEILKELKEVRLEKQRLETLLKQQHRDQETYGKLDQNIKKAADQERGSAVHSQRYVIEKKKPGIFGKTKRDKDWLLHLLSNPAFSIAQLRVLEEAYKRGLDKKTLVQIANPAIDEYKMRLLLGILLNQTLEMAEVGGRGGDDACPQAEDKR